MGKRTILTPEQIEELQKRRDSGEYVEKLAREYRIRTSRVIKLCDKKEEPDGKNKMVSEYHRNVNLEDNYIATIAQNKRINELFNKIRPGMLVDLLYKVDDRKKKAQERSQKTNIHKGEIIQVTGVLFTVQDCRGFKQSICINQLLCGDVKVVLEVL